MERDIERRPVREREREYSLSREREPQAYTGTLKEIARFGVAFVRDVDPEILSRLTRLRAVEIKKVITGRFREHIIVVPTRLGRSVAKALCQEREAICRPVPNNRISHEAAVYRMYLMESSLLREQGATIVSIRLEHDFKRDLSREIYAARGSREEVARYARRNELHVMDGKIRLPDLRIEYRDRDGSERHIDREVASSSRGSGALQIKRSAGMKIYTRQQMKSGKDRHDDMAKLLS